MGETLKDVPHKLIIKNTAQCLICGDILVSKYRHDRETCRCGNLSVDGGNDYLRRCHFKGVESWKDLSEYSEADYVWDGYGYKLYIETK